MTTFPQGFVWGAAAASYQIEGAAHTDGRGLSVWDMFSRRPGKVYNGDNGIVACDHYHRYAEDVGLMARIGLKAYRLSVSWSRVLPAGTGAVNEAGIGFYDRLIDTLLAADITPYLTLFHWDYPYALYCKGGWLNRDTVGWFAEYTEVLVRRLGDRVKHYMTVNEPGIFTGLGHEDGAHAPGDKLGMAEVARITHHVLLSHAAAVQVIRTHVPDAEVGIVSTGLATMPADDSPATIEAARTAMFASETLQYSHQVWLDPIFKGGHSLTYTRLLEADGAIHAGDMAAIQQPIDFLGVNLYQGR